MDAGCDFGVLFREVFEICFAGEDLNGPPITSTTLLNDPNESSVIGAAESKRHWPSTMYLYWYLPTGMLI